MREFNYDILSLLRDFSASPEVHPKFPVGWLEKNTPELITQLTAAGFLKEDRMPESIEYGDDQCAIHCHEREDGTLFRFFFEDDGDGPLHVLKDEQCLGWQLDFTPLTEILRNGLNCHGQCETIHPGYVWRVGTATRQSREVWLIRNLYSNSDVQRLAQIPKNALVFQFGADDLTNPVGVAYNGRLFNLLDGANGKLMFNSIGVTDALTDMLEEKRQQRAGSARPEFGTQNNYQFALENWLWAWFDARLKAAKVVEFNDEPDPDINEKWVNYEILTQKQICDELAIKPNVFSRAKDAWKTDVAGYGQFFLLITNEFVKRRPILCKESGEMAAAQRLNNFYSLHREVITSARMHRPHNI